jgi:DNA-binding MarR family transcriptional regulator
MTSTPPLATYSAFLSRMAALKLGDTQASILLAIAEGVTGPTDIANRLGLSPSSIGGQCELLQLRKLIRKTRKRDDQRRITYTLRPDGQQALDALIPAAADDQA